MTAQIKEIADHGRRHDPVLDEAQALAALILPPEHIWGGEAWREHRRSREDFLDGCRHFILSQASAFGSLISGHKRRFTQIHILRACIFVEEAAKAKGYLEKALEADGIKVAYNAADPQQALNAAVLRLLSAQNDEIFTSPSEITRNAQAMTGLKLLAQNASLEIKFGNSTALYELIQDCSRTDLCAVAKADKQANKPAVDRPPPPPEDDAKGSEEPSSSQKVTNSVATQGATTEDAQGVLAGYPLYAEIDAPSSGCELDRFILFASKHAGRIRLYGPVVAGSLDCLHPI